VDGVYISPLLSPFDDQMQINEVQGKKLAKIMNLPLIKGGFHASGQANSTEKLHIVRKSN
jgi:hypothetical protein